MKNTPFPSHSTSGLIGVPTMDYDNPKKKIGSTIPYTNHSTKVFLMAQMIMKSLKPVINPFIHHKNTIFLG